MRDIAELIVWASMGAISGLNEIAAAYMQATGHKLVIHQESRAELEQRLLSDTPADLIVQTTSVMDGVIARGKVVEGSSVISPARRSAFP